MKDDPKLLLDIFEHFLRAQEILEEKADYDVGGGNAEAQLLADIQDQPDSYGQGLLTRVKNAMKKDVLG